MCKKVKSALKQRLYHSYGMQIVSILALFARKALVLLDRSFSVIFVFCICDRRKQTLRPQWVQGSFCDDIAFIFYIENAGNVEK